MKSRSNSGQKQENNKNQKRAINFQCPKLPGNLTEAGENQAKSGQKREHNKNQKRTTNFQDPKLPANSVKADQKQANAGKFRRKAGESANLRKIP